MANHQEDLTNVMAFDALYTTNQIQKCKVLLPYMESGIQKHFAVYIKFMELQYTMDYVRKHPFQICGCSIDHKQPDLRTICKELCRYSSPEEIRQLEQLQNMLDTMEQFQEISQTMSLMQDLFPDLGNSGNKEASCASSGAESTSPSMLDMLMGMLTPEQKAMYEMFQQTKT